MMQAAMMPDRANCGPILVHPTPAKWKQAMENLCVFSDEKRQANAVGSSFLIPVTSVPRLRQCYGWLKLTDDDLLRLVPRKFRPPYIKVEKITRTIQRDVCYIGLVCEFVDEASNRLEVVQQVLDLLRSAGFSHTSSPRAYN